MTNQLRSLGFVVLMAATLAGCTLYFNDNDDDGRGWSDGSGSDGWGGDGYYCADDRECAAGCYCDENSGVCEEAGYCSVDRDCPDGFVCDDRSSCVPSDTCTSDDQCLAGSFCNEGACETSCVCDTDADAQAQGFGYCDEVRNTCMPSDPSGSCAGAVTCNTRAPQCAAGSVPTVLDGCYTGNCEVITSCDVSPVCGALQYEVDCLNANDDLSCGATFVGINCRAPDGSSCTAGASGCTCERFEYSSCSTLEGKTLPTGQPLTSSMYFSAQ